MIASISFCIVDELADQALLEACVAAIRRLGMNDCEILIRSAVDPHLDAAQHVPEGQSPAEQASKDYVLMIDSAMELAPDWLEKVQSADCFEVIGTQINSPAGQRIVDWAYFDRRNPDGPPFPAHYDEWSPRAFVSGLLMLARRDVLLAAAPARECLTGYQADAALCRRVEESGYRCGAVPGARALYRGPTAARAGREDMTFERARKLAVRPARDAMAAVSRAAAEAAMKRYPLVLRARLKILSLLYRLAIADAVQAAIPLLKLRRNPPGRSFRVAAMNVLAPYRLVSVPSAQGRRDVRRCWQTLCCCAAAGIDRVALYETGAAAVVACLLSCRMPVKIAAICAAPGGPPWRLKGWPLSDEASLASQTAAILIASVDRVPFLRERLLGLGVADDRIMTLLPPGGLAAR
ncbi:MAG: hypothetical protein LLG01_16090 [Planctomycetaceae bacterium]|nr:hypothetical protein [Planctomycetaceae bacterium]